MRTKAGRSLIGIVGVTSVILAWLTASPTPASAGPATPYFASRLDVAQEDGNAQANALNLLVIGMRRAGMAQPSIDAVLVKEYKLQLVSEPVGTEMPQSSESILTVPRPNIYRDQTTRQYYVIATWSFTSLSALRSDAGSGCTGRCNVGGYDAFGIAFNRRVSSAAGYSASAWGASSTFPPASLTMVDAGTDGVATRGQDRMCGGASCGALDFSFYNGQLVYSIGTPGCGQLQVFSEYGHTWSTTALTGLTIGVDNIGISWSPIANGWDNGSLPSNVVTPC